MEQCPKLSNKLIVLIKKALEEEICKNDGSLDELIQSYNLPLRRASANTAPRVDVQSYYQSAVSDLNDLNEKNENAALILAALFSDLATDSPILDRPYPWEPEMPMKDQAPPHIMACMAELEAEGVDVKSLFAFTKPIIRGELKRPIKNSRPPASANNVVRASPSSPRSPQLGQGGVPKVFIIHGHDELNVRRLRDYLRDELKLTPVVMTLEAGKGRTLIEKFEQEAEGAAYVFALLTPDDVVQTADKRYAQARPNVAFELGWFFGRLGRQNVCILLKKGTVIHSDLDGISRSEFGEDVTEKAIDIEKELREAGISLRLVSSK